MHPKFINLEINPKTKTINHITLVPSVIKLFKHYHFALFDDYFNFNDNTATDKTLQVIGLTSPCFWSVVEKTNGEFAGIAILDGWVGNKTAHHSATITTCFRKKFRGNFTKIAADMFIKYAFETYKLKKIKAEVFAHNHQAIGLLNYAGFKKEAVLKNETLVSNKSTDLIIYANYNNL